MYGSCLQNEMYGRQGFNVLERVVFSAVRPTFQQQFQSSREAAIGCKTVAGPSNEFRGL